MTGNKTRITDAPVQGFFDTVSPPARAAEAQALDRLFRRVTGFVPRMSGPSVVGYGRHRGVLGELIAAGPGDLAAHWPVEPL